MFSEEEMQAYDEEVLHHVSQLKLAINEDIHKLQNSVKNNENQLLLVKKEVEKM